MKKWLTAVVAISFIVLIAIVVLNLEKDRNLAIGTAKVDINEQYDNEEKPKEVISEEEKAVNQRRLERMQKRKTSLKSTSMVSSYANGKIKGTWEQFRFRTYPGSPYGFRTKGSVYDKKNDVLYAMMERGHMWKINRDPSDPTKTSWELINHHEDFVSSYIEGITTSEGAFRMVRSGNTGMEYSDNEGKSWAKATGVYAIEKSYEGATIQASSGNRIFVLLKTNTANWQVYISDDDGLTYQATETKFNPSSYWVKLFRIHNSESVFLAVYSYATKKVTIYEHEVEGSGFVAQNTSTTTFSTLDHIFGTYSNEKYHFYVGTSKTDVYYSSDKGASWTLNQFPEESGNTNVRTVHPHKPNMIFRGYLDVNMSTDYGASFTNFKHALGWDVHHMKFHQRTDGSYFHFVGKDFGCYISDTPENAGSYISLNDNSPAQMCYDAAHSENFNSSFTATQDRGTVGFENRNNDSRTYDVRTTDGLRVTLANNDASVWTWMYFGNIMHKSNFAANNGALTGKQWTSSWWAAPMIASPYPYDDAIFVAAGPKLKKFTYNPSSKSIIQTEHYFDFQTETGSNVSGFAYSPLNKNRWYASTLNGVFLYSENAGQTFARTSYSGAKPSAKGSWHKEQHTIIASDINEKTVYYAGGGKLFLISKDGGKTFTNHTRGLDIYRFYDFDLSADEKFIFAACGGAGIWVYSVDDDQWYEINDDPIPFTSFTDVEFLDKRNEVKFSTWGNGVLTLKIDGEFENIVQPDNLDASVTSNSINLNWEDHSNNEDGFVIERTQNGTFFKVGEVASNVTSFIDNLNEKGEYIYRIRAFNSTDVSYYSNYAFIEKGSNGEVAKSGWKLLSVSSEEPDGYSATNAFDGDEGTMWHTNWKASPAHTHPHTIVIDMIETSSIKGFGYLPRQDNNLNGTIKGYEFYISIDNTNWTKVANGSWAANFDEKLVEFSKAYDARFIKLVALSEVNGASFASCAEISVYTQMPAQSALEAPQFVQGGRLSDSNIELIWLDMSDNEDGFTLEQKINGEFVEIYNSPRNATTYTVSPTELNRSYTFRLKSFNSKGSSPYSQEFTVFGEGVIAGIASNKTEMGGLSVYPNPCNDYLNFSLNTTDNNLRWQIVNLSGNLVKEGLVINEQKIDVRNLSKGNYILLISGQDFKKSITFTKN